MITVKIINDAGLAMYTHTYDDVPLDVAKAVKLLLDKNCDEACQNKTEEEPHNCETCCKICRRRPALQDCPLWMSEREFDAEVARQIEKAKERK